MELDKILNADLDDLIFDNRNKEYGAYQLRKIYKKHITNATFIMLAVLVFGFSYPYLKDLLFPDVESTKPKVTATLTELSAPPPLDKSTPPPPPPAVEPPPKTIKFTPPVVVPDDEVPPEEEPPTIKDLQETPPSNNTNLDPNAQVDFTPPTNPVVDPEPTKPFLSVEQMPQYPGGENALIAYLSKNIKYPPAATENSIEGPVVLQFVVNADGSISDITVLRPLEGGCTEEAIRVVRNMPRWAPGQQNGKSVPVYFTLPVTFQLTSQE